MLRYTNVTIFMVFKIYIVTQKTNFVGKTGCQKTLAAVQTMSKRETPSPTKSGQNNNFPSPDVENKVPS